MFVYIDESGIHRPTGYSVFAAVYIKEENLSLVNASIRGIENQLGIPYFHWADLSWSVKQKFYNAVKDLPFRFKVCTFSNPIKPESALYDFLDLVLSENGFNTIYIDGVKPKWYVSRIKRTLQAHGRSIAKLRLYPSSTVEGLRLADMIAGIFRLHADGSKHPDLHKMQSYLLKTKTPSGEGAR